MTREGMASYANFGVVGGGAWGTALAQLLAAEGAPVRLWARETDVVAAINAVAGGGSVIDPKIVEVLVEEKTRAERSPLADLTEREVLYLMDHEWATSATDVVWRRSKLGLRLTRDEIAALDSWMAARRAAAAISPRAAGAA